MSGISGTIEGIQGLLIYLVVYVLMTINVFGIILFPLRQEFINSVSGVIHCIHCLQMAIHSNGSRH